MKVRLGIRGRLVAVCVCIFVVTHVVPVKADSSFSVLDSWGVFIDAGTTYLPVGSLVQLIWSADNAYASTLEGALDASGLLADGDYLLFSGATTMDGGWTGDLDGNTTYTSANVGGNPLPSGYVYGRVFNWSNTLASAGTLYGLTALIPVINEATNMPAPEPDTVDFSPTEPYFVLNQTVAIPEPASLALGLVGVGMLLIRRRLSRR